MMMFPLEYVLGLVKGATPLLADELSRLMGEGGHAASRVGTGAGGSLTYRSVFSVYARSLKMCRSPWHGFVSTIKSVNSSIYYDKLTHRVGVARRCFPWAETVFQCLRIREVDYLRFMPLRNAYSRMHGEWALHATADPPPLRLTTTRGWAIVILRGRGRRRTSPSGGTEKGSGTFFPEGERG